MSRLLRIGKNMVELSGLRNVWVGSDHLSRSKMTLFYPNKPTVEITYEYGKWEECDKDATIIKEAMKDFEICEVRQSNNNILL